MQAPSHETLKGTRSERVSLIGFVRGKKKKKKEKADFPGPNSHVPAATVSKDDDQNLEFR